jgi:hypothetical protein
MFESLYTENFIHQPFRLTGSHERELFFISILRYCDLKLRDCVCFFCNFQNSDKEIVTTICSNSFIGRY